MLYNKNYAIMTLEKEFEIIEQLLSFQNIKTDLEHTKKVKKRIKELNEAISILKGDKVLPCQNCQQTCDCHY